MENKIKRPRIVREPITWPIKIKKNNQEYSPELPLQKPIEHSHGETGENNEQPPREHPHGYDTTTS